jgi:hypothetical protein
MPATMILPKVGSDSVPEQPGTTPLEMILGEILKHNEVINPRPVRWYPILIEISFIRLQVAESRSPHA